MSKATPPVPSPSCAPGTGGGGRSRELVKGGQELSVLAFLAKALRERTRLAFKDSTGRPFLKRCSVPASLILSPS